MKLNLISTCTTRSKIFLMSALLLMLSACGGGNGGPGAPLGPGEKSFADVVLSSNPSSGIVTAATPLVIIATLTDDLGDPVPHTLVTFEITPTPTSAGSFSSSCSSATSCVAATDTSGNAQVIIQHGTSGNSAQVVATATFDDSGGTSVSVTSSGYAFTSQ